VIILKKITYFSKKKTLKRIILPNTLENTMHNIREKARILMHDQVRSSHNTNLINY
jgi:hypothetical protein